MLKQTSINKQTAWVYSPDVSQALPTVIFYPGVGGSITSQGPLPFLQKGWTPPFNVVCIQTWNAYGTPYETSKDIADIKAQVKVSSLHLTGLSGGMGRIIQFIASSVNHGIASIVVFSYTAAAKEMVWNQYPPTWGLVGDTDRYKNSTIDIVNGVKAAGTEAILTVYSGGHSGWQKFYDPTWKQDGKSIYDFMAGVTVVVPPPPPVPEPTPVKKIITQFTVIVYEDGTKDIK